MAAEPATERFSGEGLDSQTNGQLQSHTTAQRVFDVTVTDPVNDDIATVVIAPNIPLPRTSHPAMPWLLCSGTGARRISPILWEVTANYESAVLGIVSRDGTPLSPLDMPPQVEWDSVTNEEEVDEDVNGDPICTVNGEPFDPPIRVPKADLVLRYARNVGSFDPSLIRQYTDTVNSDTILGQPAGTARITKLKAASDTDSEGFTYWKAMIEVVFRRGAPRTTDAKAWYRRVRAQGYWVKTTAFFEDTIAHAYTPAGQPVTKPVLHDTETGEEIVVTPGTWPEAQWYEFEVFESKPFGALGIF